MYLRAKTITAERQHSPVREHFFLRKEGKRPHMRSDSFLLEQHRNIKRWAIICDFEKPVVVGMGRTAG